MRKAPGRLVSAVNVIAISPARSRVCAVISTRLTRVASAGGRRANGAIRRIAAQCETLAKIPGSGDQPPLTTAAVTPTMTPVEADPMTAARAK